MRKIKYAFLVIASALLLTSCVANIKMNPQDRQSLKTISLDPAVAMPNNMYFHIEGQNLGLVGWALYHTDVERLQNFDIKNNIDFKKIVLAQWAAQLKQQNINLSSQSNTILTTEVLMYGTQVRVPFSSEYGPMLSIRARMTRNGKVVWQDSESVLSFAKGMPNYRLADIFNNPKDFEIMLNAAAKEAVRKFIANINSQQQ